MLHADYVHSHANYSMTSMTPIRNGAGGLWVIFLSCINMWQWKQKKLFLTPENAGKSNSNQSQPIQINAYQINLVCIYYISQVKHSNILNFKPI